MPALQVKDCPVSVYERLRERAAQENRSISQQALTIIESYLGLRNEPSDSAVVSAGPSLLKRERVCKRINTLRPLPVTRTSPDSATILKAVRRDDAL